MRTPGNTACHPHGPYRVPRRHALALLGGALWAPTWVHAAEGALLTLVDGEVTLIEEARRSAGAAGVRLPAGTLVDVSPASTVVRVEWPGGAALDLAAGARAMIAPPGFAPRSGLAPLAYLLQGWAKLSSAGRDPVAGVVTPALELLPMAGAAVVVADRRERFVFAETGAMELLERPGGKREALPSGALYGATGTLPRPAAEWLARVPRGFRDPLPRRAASLAGRGTSAVPLPPPTYAQVADWLAAEPGLRRAFPRRFAAWAEEPAFRRALLANERNHPEWGPVLRPPSPAAPTPPAATPAPAPAASWSR